MTYLTKLSLALSRVYPLVYLLTYLAAIPAFGLAYVLAAPRGFYAPYARYEPDAVSDTVQLTSTLERALHRSFDARRGKEFFVGDWKLDSGTLRVDSVNSTDGTHLSFSVRVDADGIGELAGARTLGWSIPVTVPERPATVVFTSPSQVTSYRFPDVDLAKYASSLQQKYRELFNVIFDQAYAGVGVLAPALALNRQEELQLQRYLRDIKGDAASISGNLPRMVYLSAVVITTLGVGDIIPITSGARVLVAAEAVIGIVLAGLFLNSLAYRAFERDENS